MYMTDKAHFTADFALHAKSSLVTAALDAIHVALPEEFSLLHHRFLVCAHSGQYLGSCTADPAAAEWDYFVIALLSFLHPKGATSAELISASDAAVLPKQQQPDSDLVADRLVPPSGDPDQVDRPRHPLHDVIVQSHQLSGMHTAEPDLIDRLGPIVIALHAVFEDMKLTTSLQTNSSSLGLLLHTLCDLLGWTLYCDHYLRDGVAAPSAANLLSSVYPQPPPCSPLSIYQWILDRIERGDRDDAGPLASLPSTINVAAMRSVCPNIVRVTAIFNALNSHAQSQGLLGQARGHPSPLLRALDDLGITLADLDVMPTGIALAIREALRQHPVRTEDDNLTANELLLLGREDLAEMRFGIKTTAQHAPSPFSETTLKPEHAEAILHAISEGTDPEKRLHDDPDDDLDAILKLRFFKDSRISDVARIFRPARTPEVEVRVTQTAEEATAERQQHLQMHATRAWAFSVGLGMVQADSKKIVPTRALSLPSTKISLRFMPTHDVGSIDADAPATPEDTVGSEWVCFHAGVAVGLQVRRDTAFVTSSWIIFNQPKGESKDKAAMAKHAGFAFGLGLGGHLKKLSMHDALSNYFFENNSMLTVGALLGLSVSHLGSQNDRLASAISTHIPGLMPENSPELGTASITHSAAAAAYGLLHLGSGRRLAMERFREQIAQLSIGPLDASNASNECYGVSCGFAIGFMGIDAGYSVRQRVRGDSIATREHLRVLAEGLLKLLSGPESDMTAPGAIVALALTFMRTEDRSISDKIAIPGTAYDLDAVHPDHLTLRVVAKSLIMWRSITPSIEWMFSFVPLFIKRSRLAHLPQSIQDGIAADRTQTDSNAALDKSLMSQAYFFILAGAALAMGLKYAGSCDPQAASCLEWFMDHCLSASSALQSAFEPLPKRPLSRCSR
nr:Anaphase-promoting complex subunit 1 [Polyrhizophydium stewartii]